MLSSQYLESKHPQGHLLFPTPAVKAFAAFLHEFGKLIAPHISVLAIPGVASLLDAPSKEYFINRKLGPAKYNRAVNATPEEKASHIESAKKMLASVESALALQHTKNHSRSKWLAGTEQPSHADVSCKLAPCQKPSRRSSTCSLSLSPGFLLWMVRVHSTCWSSTHS